MLDVTGFLKPMLFFLTLKCVRVGSSTVCVSECVLIISIKFSCNVFLSVSGSIMSFP